MKICDTIQIILCKNDKIVDRKGLKIVPTFNELADCINTMLNRLSSNINSLGTLHINLCFEVEISEKICITFLLSLIFWSLYKVVKRSSYINISDDSILKYTSRISREIFELEIPFLCYASHSKFNVTILKIEESRIMIDFAVSPIPTSNGYLIKEFSKFVASIIYNLIKEIKDNQYLLEFADCMIRKHGANMISCLHHTKIDFTSTIHNIRDIEIDLIMKILDKIMLVEATERQKIYDSFDLFLQKEKDFLCEELKRKLRNAILFMLSSGISIDFILILILIWEKSFNHILTHEELKEDMPELLDEEILKYLNFLDTLNCKVLVIVGDNIEEMVSLFYEYLQRKI